MYSCLQIKKSRFKLFFWNMWTGVEINLQIHIYTPRITSKVYYSGWIPMWKGVTFKHD